MTLELDHPATTSDTGEQPETRPARARWLPWFAATALAAVAVWLGWGWHQQARELAALHDRTANSDRAAAVAKEYATKSLTYDFHHLDAFFDSVRAGTTASLADRYTTVHDTLSKIMTEAQVVAHGEVVATAVSTSDDKTYTVTVFATQTTQNARHPDPITASTLLTVTVQHTDDRWLVSDYHAR
ncbi:hypothetical protein NDR87_00310 [Nocardia sp. CDC159]|uniref:Mce-associated membrane protein n=1 Tax=Nocardia pulmonis TaxID=2951408 RepID=A0A9X2E1X2_9NOCA|nr:MULTISPECIES: hypothetical protein [Nocardia]MCM6772547.1 hypothetical protein [Nocardia pulmonis]MCM6784795.1 hypothetical protein [Nocardia sp. CDC159]